MGRNFKTVIDKFLGLHEGCDGESRLKRGESPRMKNLTVTPSYTLLQRDGWERVVNTSGEGRGLYTGALGIFWVIDEKIWRLVDGEESLVGTLESNSGKVSIFEFDSCLYFLDGVKIKEWNGESLGDINPYVPLVAVSCDHNGAGTPFESVNLLTGRKRQSYTPNGTNATFALAEKNIDKVNFVKKFGELVVSSQYTVNLENGTVTFKNVPEVSEPNCIEITYTKGSGSVGDINRMRYATAYGGDNDTRVFLWGDSEYPSHIRYSGVYNGLSGMRYFPELNFNKIGSLGAVTSVIRHYDRLLIFTESEAFQTYGETRSDAVGTEYTVFPIKTLSSEVGCSVQNFAKLIDNKPVTIAPSGLYRWSSSTIRDERNAEEIGERIRRGLRELCNASPHSFDRASHGELYIWSGEKIYIYNYALDVFYYYEGFGAVEFSEDSTNTLWFVRSDGALCREIAKKLDDSQSVDFVWESGYEESAGLETKNVHRLEFELQPVSATSFSFIWVSERSTGRHETLEVDYKVTDFTQWYFDDMSFNTASTPVRLTKRIKTKRTRGMKLILKNDADRGDFHLLSIGVEGRISDTQ